VNLPRALPLLLALAPLAAADTLHVPDDFATPQAAVDAALPGDEIVLHKGVYAAPVLVTDRSDLVIRGAGKAVIDATGQDNGLVLSGCSNIEVRNLQVDGATLNDIWLQECDAVEVHHCKVNGALGAGILVDACTNVQVYHNQVFGMESGGWPESGVRVGDSSEVTVERNHVSFVISGIRFFPASNDSVVSRNVIHDLWHAGIEAIGNGNLVERNSVRDSSDDGIFCSGSGTIITRNKLRDLFFGITIFDGSNNLVERNVIKAAGGVGIWVKSGASVTDLVSNRVLASGETLGGLRFEGTDGSSLEDRVLKSKGTGLFVTGTGHQIDGLRIVKPADGGVELDALSSSNMFGDARVTGAGTDGFVVGADSNALTDCRAMKSAENGFLVTGTGNAFITCKAKGSGNLDKNESEGVTNSFIGCEFGTESP
jgi:nitrous oxidase accessory protein NosD